MPTPNGGAVLEVGSSLVPAFVDRNVNRKRDETHRTPLDHGHFCAFVDCKQVSLALNAHQQDRVASIITDFSGDGRGTLLNPLPYTPCLDAVPDVSRPSVLLGIDVFGTGPYQQTAMSVIVSGTAQVRNTGFDIPRVGAVVTAVPGITARIRYPPDAKVENTHRPTTLLTRIRPTTVGTDWVEASTFQEKRDITPLNKATFRNPRTYVTARGARVGRVLLSALPGQLLFMLLSPPAPKVFGRM